jgi:hypothetical protein
MMLSQDQVGILYLENLHPASPAYIITRYSNSSMALIEALKNAVVGLCRHLSGQQGKYPSHYDFGHKN